ncbi:methyl-accepting chemotaxis protein [Arcobacter sp. YIC-464]|uniref:methyl-accepting chemotaxis protein n=1 Tax=Arcobacter sp. YIC-464 TaxID=3376631 RepID=UPI003C22A5E8
MKTTSLKTKILVVVSLCIVISFFILGFYNTTNNYNNQYSIIKNKELSLAEDSSKFIDAYIQSKIDIIEALTKELEKIEVKADDINLLKKLELSKNAGKFVDVYVGFNSDGSLVLSNGDILNVPKDNYDARGRPWYKDAVKNKKSGVSKPYVDVSTKKLVISVYTPLYQNDKLIGVVGSDIFIDTIVESILNVSIDGEGFAYLLDNEGNVLIHKNKELLNKKSYVYSKIDLSTNLNFIETTNKDSIEKLISYSSISKTGWIFVVELDKDTIFEEIENNTVKEIILYIILLAVTLTLLYFVLIKILAPIKDVEEGLQFFFRYLKGQESNIQKLNINTNDEFGNMAQIIDYEMEEVAKSLDTDRKVIENVKNVVSQVNEGKLDIKVEASTNNKSLNELKDILNDMIETIKHNVNSDINPIMEQLKEYSALNFKNSIQNANGNVAIGLNDLCNIINQMLQENKYNGLELEKSSNELLTNVDILNKASNETAVSLEETAAALEEITSTVANNTNRISQMSAHSKELSDSIKKGQDLANSTVVSMDEINEQTQAIAEAITVIDQIAFQTNILSLNAAVEAATAGEAGKGFAVVAQEVRNLAARSAEAAKEIKDIVEKATAKTNNGKTIADEMINGYQKLNENIYKTTEAIGDISESSREQKTSIEQINDVINRLDQQTQNNASVATQTHNIAKNTSILAQKILEAVHKKEFREK